MNKPHNPIPEYVPGNKRIQTLSRPQVDRLLKAAIEKPVVAVVAGAGCGKSIAVSNFLRKYGETTMWVSLMQLDNHPARFWEMLAAMVEKTDPEFSAQMRKMGFPETLEVTNRFLRMMAASCYRAERVFLAFDDLHLIDDPAVLQFIENLLAAHIENLTVFLISRNMPEFEHFSMYAGNRVAFVTRDDLRFTDEEIKEYLAMGGIRPDDALLERICKATEGWPVAVYLTRLQAEKHGPEEDPIPYTVPLIHGLLGRDLFSRYSGEAQRALLLLSLLEDFSAELVKDVSGEAFSEVMDILDSNMFVSFNPYDGRYSFQQFFAGFLKEKQPALGTEEKQRFYAQAAQWCYSQKAIVEAVSYYEKCGDYDAIWEIMRHYNQYDDPGGKAALFLEVIDRFPVEFYETHRIIRVFRAFMELQLSHIHTAHADLLEMERILLAEPPAGENRQLLGEVYLGLALISRIRYSWDFVAYFEKADAALAHGSELIDEKQLFLGPHHAIFLFSPAQGELQRAVDTLFAVMPVAAHAMNGCGFGTEYLAAAEASYFQNDPDTAEKYAWQAISRAKRKRQYDIVCQSYMLLMRIEFGKGDYKETVAHLKELRAYVQRHPHPLCGSILDIAESWFYVRIGHRENVSAWILDDTLNGRLQAPINVSRDRLIKAEYLLENKEYYELLGELEETEEFCAWRGFWFLLLKARILMAIGLYRSGDLSLAAKKLKEAYDMAEGNDITMFFIEQGRSMRALAQAVKHKGRHGIPIEWLDSMQKKASTFAKRQLFIANEYEKEHRSTDVGGNLSTREREVLSALCQALTREEIADTYGISVNTVKSILRSIYNKLGAVNRADAVRIALDFNLVSPA